MRNLFIAFLLVLCAVLWAGCPTAVQTATKTIHGVTLATQEVECGYKKLAIERLDLIAKQERAAREAALAKAGCVTTTATPECQKIADEAKAKYEARKGKVVTVATKLHASTGVVYTALLAAVDVLMLVRDGLNQHRMPELAKLVAAAVEVGKALADTYRDFQKESP